MSVVENREYSVLMSVYHKEKPEYLKQAIESIQAQTLSTNDFVLVCDGPLNEQLDGVIATKQQEMGDILNVVRLAKNGGLGNALNEGIKHCKNELVARMDSDDIAYPDRCEKQIAVFNTHPEVSICSGIVEEFTTDPNTVDTRRVPPETNALKDEMIRVIRGKSSIDRDMIQQLLDENQAAIQAAQDALTAAQNKLEEIEQENKKAENDCSNLFTWASTYQNASFQQRQAILNQFIKEVRVGRDYDIEIILNVPLEEFEEFKSHSLSVRTPSGRKTDLKQAPVKGLGTPNGGIVVFDKTSGEAMNIMPKSSAHVTLRCQDE